MEKVKAIITKSGKYEADNQFYFTKVRGGYAYYWNGGFKELMAFIPKKDIVEIIF